MEILGMRWSVMLNVIRWERWLEGGLLDAGAFRGKYKAIVDVMERVRMFVDGLVITHSLASIHLFRPVDM